MVKQIKNTRLKASVFFIVAFFMCSFLMLSVSLMSISYSDYHEFENDIEKVFTDEFVGEIADVASTPKTYYNLNGADSKNSEIDYFRVFRCVLKKSSSIGLNAQRTVYILDKNGNLICSTDESNKFEMTSAVIAGMNGEKFVTESMFSKQLEYAYPINTVSGERLIIYIRDSREKNHYEIVSLIRIGIEAIIIVVIFSIVFGFAFSKLARKPINRFTELTRKMVKGESNAYNDVKEGSDFYELSNVIKEVSFDLSKTSVDIKKEKNKIEAILQTMSDGVLAFDVSGNLIHINKQAKRLIGLEYIEDVTFDSLFKELQAGISIGDILYIPSEEEIERNITIGNKFIKINITTFKIDNKISGIVAVLYDITKFEKLEQARKNFVADVSHELRTPLTTIKSYSETLAENPDSTEELRTKFLNVISSEADRMVRIISDLLTLSQLDEKHKAFRPPETIDVRAMTERVIERLTFQAKQKDQNLIFMPMNEIPTLLGNADGLERVIINIIGNAIKYTPSGGKITVYISKIYNDVCIKVSDNGIGISQEFIPHLFDRFYRVDKARSRDKGGTGLGLAIAKQTIESEFNGKITISSELNIGTDVSIIIPLNK